ncbi:hypothetical protein BKA57DRAFT_226050 [Linnemannia elongata]|nr:hypothetical protein BKA57DRAFT_226050 [Linnemannia elongata]
MRACEIFSVRLTHAGRHAGTKEAFKLGLGIQDIQHLGRWVMNQMMSFYAPKNPIKGAYFMAHFNGTDEPYILERDLVPPPPELQVMLFGWIEQVFDGHDDRIVEAWHKTCMEEMIGYDPDEVREDDVFFEAKTDIPAAQSGLEQSAHTDKVAFLKLMVRMRRVIIQDAVLCLQPVPGTGRTLSNSLIEKLPEIFQSQLFLEYSKELLQAIEQHRETSSAIAAGIHVDGADIIEAINRSGSQQTVLNRTLAAMEATHQKQLEQQHERHAQAMAVQMAQYTRLQEAHESVLKALEEFKEMRQQLLIQYSQHPRPLSQHPRPPFQHPGFNPQPSQHYQQPYFHPQPSQHSQLPHFHPRPLRHHAPHQQQQQQAPQAPFDYMMHPDKGAWTLRNAWDEYHGPLARAYTESHKSWGENQKRQYRRRTELIEQIRKKAAKEAKPIDSILDCEDYKGMSINAVKELLKAESSKAAVTTEE